MKRGRADESPSSSVPPTSLGSEESGASSALQRVTSNPSFADFDTLMDQSGKESAWGISADRVRRRDTSVNSDGTSPTIGSGLEKMFYMNFQEINTKTDNSYAKAFSQFAQTLEQSSESGDTGSDQSHGGQAFTEREPILYEQLLSMLAPNMIDLLAIRIGSLTDHITSDSEPKVYASSLAADETKTMFDPPITELGADPLEEYNSHQTIQMIDVWFSEHPLSSIISKTLLLRSYRSGVYDRTLLATILADACGLLEEPAAKHTSEKLLNWACEQLRYRPTVPLELSTAQTLMLLGWREMCLNQGRRTTCFIGYAGRVVVQLQKDLAGKKSVSVGQINGVSIAAVELELVWNTYWLAYTLTIWAFMQMNQPITELLPHKIPTIYPPIDDNSSAIIKLDIKSDNVSTLRAQRRAMRELWPLSHITSAVAHIYALHPQTRALNEEKHASTWQAQPALKLRALLDPKDEVEDICSNIRHILTDSLQMLERQECTPSAPVVAIAYHIIIIHILFNYRRSGDLEEIPVDPSTMDSFLSSAQVLLSLFVSQMQAENTTEVIQSRKVVKCSIATSLIVTGLNVCGNGLRYVKARMEKGNGSDAALMERNRGLLLSLASQFLQIVKDETSLPMKQLKVAKKNLKEVQRYMEGRNIDSLLTSSTSSLSTGPTSTPYFDPSNHLEAVQLDMYNAGGINNPVSSGIHSGMISPTSAPMNMSGFSVSSDAIASYISSQGFLNNSISPQPRTSTSVPDSGATKMATGPNEFGFAKQDVWMDLNQPWTAARSTEFYGQLDPNSSGAWTTAATEVEPLDMFNYPLADFGNLPQRTHQASHINSPTGIYTNSDGGGTGPITRNGSGKTRSWEVFRGLN
jgi:hypothetical protein